MLCVLGDLVDDVVVWLGAPIAPDTDTPTRVFHRRGGSAANVAAFAARAGRAARFIGQVGDDPAGRRLVAELEAVGVEACVALQPGGRTGTVVVLVHPGGGRTMLADRGAAVELAAVPDPWLCGVEALHLTAYSLTAEPVSTTARAAVATARRLGCRLVTVDASSVSVLSGFGPRRFLDVVAGLAPDVLFANAAEADVLGLGPGRLLPAQVGAVVVKHGAEPATLLRPGVDPVTVPPPPSRGVVADTTGAGDAFAAGFLDARLHGADDVDAVAAGHGLAAAVLGQPGATLAGERA